MKRRITVFLAAAMLVILALCTCASAAWAPKGPVTMIIAYKAGNGTDLSARILAKFAEKYVGQTIVIENVDGGAGSIGWSQLARAKADGQTIGFINLPNFNSSIVKELGSYTINDFTAICNHVTETSVIVVRADDKRFNSLKDLVEYAKANTTKASTNGSQASNHIGAQAFANSAGISKYIDIPQGNTADELTSLFGKEADWCVVKVGDLAGKESMVKVLGAFSKAKLPEAGFEKVPLLKNLGYYKEWLGSSRMIVAPKGIPAEAVRFYAEAFKKAMSDPEYVKAAKEGKLSTNYIGPAKSAALIKQQQQFTEGLAKGFWYK